jgi:hypothetical protein
MAFASLVIGAGGIVEQAFAIMGSQIGEIDGFTSGWVVAAYAEAVFIIPTILRAIHVAVPPLRHRPSKYAVAWLTIARVQLPINSLVPSR